MAEAGDAGSGPERAGEGGAQREEGVFGCVVVVDCDVTISAALPYYKLHGGRRGMVTYWPNPPCTEPADSTPRASPTRAAYGPETQYLSRSRCAVRPLSVRRGAWFLERGWGDWGRLRKG